VNVTDENQERPGGELATTRGRIGSLKQSAMPENFSACARSQIGHNGPRRLEKWLRGALQPSGTCRLWSGRA